MVWWTDGERCYRLGIGSLQIYRYKRRIDSPPLRHSQFKFSFHRTGCRSDTHRNGFWLLCREYQYVVSDLHENGWRNDQGLADLPRHRIDRAVLCVQGIAEFLSVHLQHHFHRKLGRIFGQADQCLVINSKGAERSRFTQPIGLRIGSILRDLAREFLRNEFVRRKRRIDFHRATGVGTSYLL